MSILGNLMGKIFGRTSQTNTPPSSPPSPSVKLDPAAATPPTVDVTAILEDMAKRSSEKLNWKTSIVDLMKLVGMDSSLTERRELAKELGYSGSTEDTAAMNIWLHKAVLKKIAENGGVVPQELLH